MISSIGSQIQSMSVGAAAPSRPSPEEMFTQLDVDGSGELDQAELQSMMDRMSERMGETGPSSEDMMTDLDIDGNGTLSIDEFEAGKPQGPPPGPPPAGGNSSEAVETDETSDEALLQQMLDMFLDGDEAAVQSIGVLV